MMEASSYDIKDMLEAESILALTYGADLFIGKEPSKPDNVVTIFDTPSFPPYLGLDTIGYEYPSIQIRVRNRKYKEGMDLIEEIKNLLHGQAQVTCNSTLYSVIYCTSGPTHLEWDDNGNAVFVCSFELQRRESNESI
jgi:hypothetical protein